MEISYWHFSVMLLEQKLLMDYKQWYLGMLLFCGGHDDCGFHHAFLIEMMVRDTLKDAGARLLFQPHINHILTHVNTVSKKLKILCEEMKCKHLKKQRSQHLRLSKIFQLSIQ